ncbi:DUF2079 domain-containing protein [Sunxiuqinia elliptica]|uniref:Uncharacterized membrane protein n=1 Tax=Sunxiuqinia elliptica TaxID=655355 RepID=A0A1I2KC87_9BACT|nr:DUF2079 domain-containing protein [Sunxiuqinia elliptica]SFF62546.1 Uncharacterized membrane protein [Sunxiuqinia elliptica]
MVKSRKKYTPLLILGFFGLLMFYMGIINHYYFRTFVFDYGNYNFAFWDYSHLRISSIPTYPGNFLQDHYSYTLFYFVPIYWLFNWLTGTYTLILIQNTLIILAGWYSYKIIQSKTDNYYLSIGALLYYFLLLGRYTTFACDVNLAVISACFIPIFLYYFQQKQYLLSFIILILSLFSRENIPIWFIFIFIVLILQHRKDKKAVLLSVGGIAISLLYFIILFKVLIPSVETEEKQFTLFNYSALGADPAEALKYVIKNPIETIKLFFINHLHNPQFDGIKTEFYWVYLTSGGILLLFRPQFLIWFIPIVAQKVLNDAPIRWGILTYYSIEVVTLLPISVFLTISSFKSDKLQKILTWVVCLTAFSMTIHKMDRSNRVVPGSFVPQKEKFFYKGFYQSPYRLRATHKLLEQIPPDAKVSASEDFFTHLSQRFHIYFFPEVRDAEYIVFSVYDNYFLKSHTENEAARNDYLLNPDWELIDSEFPVFLMRKRKDSGQNQQKATTPLTAAPPESSFCNFEHIDLLTNSVRFNNGLIISTKEALTKDIQRSGNNSLKLTQNNRFSKAITPKNLARFNYLEAMVWVYGENIKDAHIVTKSKGYFYFQSNTVQQKDNLGWKQIRISCWIPENTAKQNFQLYLWNAGNSPLYFDDFELSIKKINLKKH